MKKVNIQALQSKKGKAQHMVPGKIYSVTEEMAEVLIGAKKAVKAKDGQKVGEVYELKGGQKDPLD